MRSIVSWKQNATALAGGRERELQVLASPREVGSTRPRRRLPGLVSNSSGMTLHLVMGHLGKGARVEAVTRSGDSVTYAFNSPRRPSPRSSAGCIFMSWNSGLLLPQSLS